MKLLLDTHVFIWWDNDPRKLSPRALALCQDKANNLFLSVASVWEMQIKRSLGKLRCDLPLETIIQSENRENTIQLVPVLLEQVLALDKLPLHHKDPFDRLLIAQAMVEGFSIITADSIFSRYSVPSEW